MPKYDPEKHRRSIRVKGYDYSTPGLCFITICTQNHKCIFGKVSKEGEMRLNRLGRIAEKCWYGLQDHFPNVQLDEFEVTPNHIHGILFITGKGTACRAPTTERFGKPISKALPTIVRSFKSAATKHINDFHDTAGAKVWQRNYYEHIIRNEKKLKSIRESIANNPINWISDPENPDRIEP